ncbi:MAG: two-component regulator propeller domain-containing protein [Emticicia sp.]|nr:two-component regulator propeller domain-containing protein [Emticicia sp.]
MDGYFKNISTDEGLPSERTYCTVQDREGFIWVGTNDGLIRYDGYRMNIYRNIENDSTSIPGNIVTQLLIDSEGFLWVGTYESGLCRFDTQTKKAVLQLNEKSKHFQLKDNKIQALWEDTRNQKLWIGTNLKIADCYDLRKKQLIPTKFSNKNLAKFQSKRDKTAWTFGAFYGDKNKVWIGINDGLLLYEYSTDSYDWFKFNANEKPENELKNRVRSITVEPNNQIWMACRGGGVVSFKYPAQTWKSYLYTPESIKSDTKNLVLHILPRENSPNELWVSTLENSLGIFNKITGQFSFFKNNPTNQHSIIADEINRVFYDKNHTLWVNTQKGISIYTERFQHFLPKTIPQASPIERKFFGPMSYAEIGNQLYFGMNNSSGLYILDKTSNKLEIIRPQGSKPDDFYSFMRMAKDSEGNLWLVSLSDLFQYSPKTKQLSIIKLPSPYSLDSLKSQSLGFDKNGMLYVGTRRRGMLRINPKTFEIKQFSKQKDKNSIAANGFIQEILCDKSGILWIATERGLSRFDPKTELFTNYFDGDNTAPKGVKTIYRLIEDKKGLIWLTTESEGAYAIDPKSLKFVKNIKQKDGLSSNAINGLACDAYNGIWLATSKGLCYYDQQTKEVFVFDKKNGLFQENLDLGIASLQNQQIILGYQNGYTVFNPTEIRRHRSQYLPKITDFYVFEKPFKWHKNEAIQLNYQQNFFGFEFSALDYLIPEKVKYNYRLDGIDNEWIEANGSGKANYTNLETGKYTFQVRATEQNSQWPTQFSSIHVIINPPFWQTWWFILLCTTFVLYMIYYLYQRKVKTLNQELQIKEQISQLKMTALRSQMNPHFIFNSLNTVRYFVISDQKDKAKDYLSKFSKLLRTILTYSKENTISLSNELEAIRLYLDVEMSRFDSNFFYSINIDEEIDVESIQIPPLLLQPYIENAIIHGLRNSEKLDKILTIKVSQTNETTIEISITDNGIGRKKANEIQHDQDILHKSFGTTITNQRIELFNQNYANQIILKTTDLANESGTQILIQIKMQ